MFETFSCADISTAHTTRKDDDLLRRYASDPNNPLVVYPFPYGYWICVPGENDVRLSEIEMLSFGYSSNLIALIILAQSEGVSWIKLDRDGRIYENLERFDW